MMPLPPISKVDAGTVFRFVQQAYEEGFHLDGKPSAVEEGARRYNREFDPELDRRTFRSRYEAALRLYAFKHKAPRKAKGAATQTKQAEREHAADKLRAVLRAGPQTIAELSLKARLPVGDILVGVEELRTKGVNVERLGDRFTIPSSPQQAYIGGPVIELVSRKDNTFCFGAFGDLHAGSKYTRWDVREDLVRRAESAGAQAIFDTGNWIDGYARFNAHDLEAHGLEEQCELLAQRHPQTKLPIYAVAGDDHEGWIAQREGVNVGRYCQNTMREGGHNWTDLGFMEAHIVLRNANSGKTASMAVVHPGGGSAYALSYSIQKIIESLEGGEKPAVGLYGHYHKLWAGNIRNVWVVQTACQQDQTPFMRKKRLEAHVGGSIITLEQHPESGAIIGMTPRLLRYFNKSFYAGTGRWSHHGPIIQPERSPEGIR
jgi:hypothetical protein